RRERLAHEGRDIRQRADARRALGEVLGLLGLPLRDLADGPEALPDEERSEVRELGLQRREGLGEDEVLAARLVVRVAVRALEHLERAGEALLQRLGRELETRAAS